MSNAHSSFRWNVAAEDRAKTSDWAQALGVPRIVAHLLMLRGVATIEDAERFLEPSVEHISDPFALEDMGAAVERITRARDDGEHVLVFGDYDVDGIAGTAILFEALRAFGIERCRAGLPSRVLGGYGLGVNQVEAAHNDGISLIITVDNGINAREAGEAVKRLGMDLIVTDHHQLEGGLPEAVAVIDPAREDPPGPCADVSGAAVAFKLAWALTGKQRDLDIVALGTVADIVPLHGENREFVAAGLNEMRRGVRPGLVALASVAGLRIEEVTAEHIAFQLGPRLNAAGRLEEADTALRLLLTDSMGEARRVAGELDRVNRERRAIERTILQEAVAQLDETLEPDQRGIVLASRNWHPGVVGIVASQLQRRYDRPVVLIAVSEEGLGRGSARSTSEFGMVDALSACADALEQFGGHRAAAGVTLREENVDAFRRAFETEAARRLPEGPAPRILDIDALLSLTEVDSQLVRVLECLQPFGHGNPAPVFCSYGVQPLPDSLRELRGGHIRFSVRQGPRVVDVVGFRMAGRLTPAQAMAAMDIAYTPQLNTWRGKTSLQLVLKDIQMR